MHLLLALAIQPGGSEQEFEQLRREARSLEKLEDADEAAKRGPELIRRAGEFLQKHPDSPDLLEAREVLVNAHRLTGRALLRLNRRQEAEAHFRDSVRHVEEVLARLRQDAEDERRQEQKVYGGVLKLMGLFHLVEVIADDRSRLDEARRIVADMRAMFDDLMFSYDQYGWAFDATTYLGRAYGILAGALGASHFTEAEKAWAQCFRYLAYAYNRLDDVRSQGAEALEAAAKAAYYDAVFRRAYAAVLDSLGIPSERELYRAVDLRDRLFGLYPALKKTAFGDRFDREVSAIDGELRRRGR